MVFSDFIIEWFKVEKDVKLIGCIFGEFDVCQNYDVIVIVIIKYSQEKFLNFGVDLVIEENDIFVFLGERKYLKKLIYDFFFGEGV